MRGVCSDNCRNLCWHSDRWLPDSSGAVPVKVSRAAIAALSSVLGSADTESCAGTEWSESLSLHEAGRVYRYHRNTVCHTESRAPDSAPCGLQYRWQCCRFCNYTDSSSTSTTHLHNLSQRTHHSSRKPPPFISKPRLHTCATIALVSDGLSQTSRETMVYC